MGNTAHASDEAEPPATDPAARRARVLHRVFWIAFVIFAIALSTRNVRKCWKKDQAALQNTAVEMDVSDFECFYRGALRMRRGEVMYWPDPATGEREMPTMLPPFQQLTLVPLTYLPPWLAELLYSIVVWVLLAAALPLGQKLLERARGRPVSHWIPKIAFLFLVPFVNTLGRYNQTASFLVAPCLLGLILLPRRSFLGGAVLALPAALKLLPIVFLPWLLFKRAWRASLGFVLGLALTTGAFVLHQGPKLAQQQFQAYVETLRADKGFEKYNERYQGFPNAIRATITPKYEGRIESKAQEIEWDGVRNFLPSAFLYENAQLVVLALCSLLILACAFATCRRWPDDDRRRLAEAGLIVVTMLLISPHTWKHYYWWAFLPLLSVLLDAHDGRRGARLLLALVLVTMTLPHRSLLPYVWMWAHVFHLPVLGLLALHAGLSWRLIRSRRKVATAGARAPSPRAQEATAQGATAET